MDPFNKTKSQTAGVAGVTPSVTDPVAPKTVVSAPVVMEPAAVTPTTGIGSSLSDDTGVATTSTVVPAQEAVVQEEVAVPDVFAPSTPPSVSSPSAAKSVPTPGGLDSFQNNEEPGTPTAGTLNTTPTSPLGQSPVVSEPDENTEGTGGTGTGLAGE